MSHIGAFLVATMFIAASAAAQEPAYISAEATNALYRRVQSQKQPQDVASPDGHLRAVYRQTHPGVYGHNFGRIAILDQGGRVIASHVLAGHGGRLVALARWSPDSKFCVFTTISAGGHSPWQFEPYTFSAASHRFRFLGDGPFPAVINPEFRFAAPATVFFATPQGVSSLQLDAPQPGAL